MRSKEKEQTPGCRRDSQPVYMMVTARNAGIPPQEARVDKDRMEKEMVAMLMWCHGRDHEQG